MSIFDIFSPSPSMIISEAPTPNLRATSNPTAAATLVPTPVADSTTDAPAPVTDAPTSTTNNGTGGTTPSQAAAPTDFMTLDDDGANQQDGQGVLTSLRYYEDLRSQLAASDVTRPEGSNLDVFVDPNTGETVALCHISHITSLTHGDFVPSRGETEDAFSIALALKHLNEGNGLIVPEIQDLNKRCPLRFTMETSDDAYSGGVALEHIVDQTSRMFPGQVPCAFIGTYRSSISIPMSIVSGLFGYPQISAASTSPELDDKTQYPLFGRTVPSDTGNAIPIILFMHKVLKIKTGIVVININDSFGNAFSAGLRDAAAEYVPGLDVHQIPLDETPGAIEAAIKDLKETEYRFVFCIVFKMETYDALMTEAVKQDVAGNGKHNWLFGDAFLGTLDNRKFEKNSPLGRGYRGVGLLEASGGVAGLPGYDKYAADMIKIKNPTDLYYMGSMLPKYDDPSYPATIKEHPFLFEDNFLNPIINGYSPFHYEAAIALGLSACAALDLDRDLPLTGVDHFAAFRNTTFQGVAGTVEFDPLTGTRLPTKTLYRVANWLPEETGDGSVIFKPTVSNLFVEGVWEEQVPYKFNDLTTAIPVDIAPPPPEDNMNLVLVVIVPVVAALIVGLLGYIYYESKRKQNDSIWKVDRKELKFSDPPTVIGQGTFGVVLLAEYRGTEVAVKHILPPRTSGGTKSGSTATDKSGSSDNQHSRSAENDNTDSVFDTSESGDKSSSRGTSSWGGASLSLASGTGYVSGLSASRPGGTGTKSRETEAAVRKRMKNEFMEEMRYLSKLRHPCVTTIMGAVVDKGEPMMIMEYMDHGSLYDLLHNETVALESEMLLNFLRDIAQGVRFLHAAVPVVIHGDLKAGNILVDSRFRAKVADFGLSQKGHLGGTGTPFWMAPELLRRESANTAASDVYSFGIILYEVYSRRDPYEGEDARLVLKAVKDQVIKKRPPTPRTMSDQIKTLYSDCIEDDAERRPSFEEIDTRLKRLDAENVESGEYKSKSTVSLFDIFPRHIAEALRDGRKVEPEHRDIVCIFFSDIVGFTDISATLEPRKVATMLDRLYTKFDTLSHQHEIFKLETIGDAYVAVTNLVKDQPDDHAKRIAEFAIDAIIAANETPVDEDDPSKGRVNIRVGFHCGPVVADVVGTRNPRYCLFGDSINTASRMESNSKENRIHCSDAAAMILKEQDPKMSLKCRGKISIKGKGEMRTWWVNEGEGRRSMSREFSDSVLVKPSKLGSYREEPSAELAAEQPSTDFNMTDIKSEATIEDALMQPPETAPEKAPEPVESPPDESDKVKRYIEFTAPPGKLGIVIDTSTGKPVVYQVHRLSSIKEHIAIGDVLCEIDGVNTRSMSHTAISALMSANAKNERRFTVEREE